jgi:hypothetical protein
MVAYYHSSQTLRARVLELGHEVHMWSEGLITFALGRMIPLQFRRDQNLQDWGGSSRIREELSARKRQGSMRNLTTTNSGLRNRLKKVMRISNLEVSGWPPPPPSVIVILNTVTDCALSFTSCSWGNNWWHKSKTGRGELYSSLRVLWAGIGKVSGDFLICVVQAMIYWNFLGHPVIQHEQLYKQS